MATTYGNWGLIYGARGDLDRAEELHRKALVIDGQFGQLSDMADDYGNLGSIYAERGDLDQAEEMYRKALDINEKLDRKVGRASQYTTWA